VIPPRLRNKPSLGAKAAGNSSNYSFFWWRFKALLHRSGTLADDRPGKSRIVSKESLRAGLPRRGARASGPSSDSTKPSPDAAR